ncbi:protein kinase domain-containing protein [Ditylenchus destructor]|nr:protein kinase domain-containing protein [Ditylenchus destructor]
MARVGGRLKKPGGIKIPDLTPPPNVDLDDKFIMRTENGSEVLVRANELEKITELGRGNYGVVEKMRHQTTGMIFAVKRIHSSIQDESQKRLIVELDACMKSGCCPQMVRFYGAMFREGDVWICMQVMDISLDKFYRMCVDMQTPVPEQFIAKIALSVVDGLNFMKEEMNLIHRDVKPSNILLNREGEVKICDFGISGHLTNSVAKTVNAGCKPYMPPERIEGDSKEAYGVQADVWSLGITLVEIASGRHPYGKWKTPFEQLKQVVQEPPPTVDSSLGYSDQFHDFISICLTKNFRDRPKYKELLEHPFLVNARAAQSQPNAFVMSEFISSILDQSDIERNQLLNGLQTNNELVIEAER